MDMYVDYLEEQVQVLQNEIGHRAPPKHRCEDPDCNAVTRLTYCKQHRPTCRYPKCIRKCKVDFCCNHTPVRLAARAAYTREYMAKKRAEKAAKI